MRNGHNMASVNESDLVAYIESNIQDFHKRRLDSLAGLKLKTILKRKNPYLFKAKNIDEAGKLVKLLLEAHLSSQEEAIFGGFLEELAIFICSEVYGGRKSACEGIDLEFAKDDSLFLVSIKSGPNWGNSRQIVKMREDFRRARKILGTNATPGKIVAVNGCCYGRESIANKGDYLKLCGQRFWSLISGEENLYTEIIDPLGHKAKERNAEFQRQYTGVLNQFTKAFIDEFCDPDGHILWDKVVRLNSSADGSY